MMYPLCTRQDIEGDIYNNRNNNEPAVCGEGGENEIEEREEGSDTAQAPVRLVMKYSKVMSLIDVIILDQLVQEK